MLIETKMDDNEEGKLFEIRKAAFAFRPFSLISNPYDHACSVLCNHPHGNRFSWIARRLALLSTLTNRPLVSSNVVSREAPRIPKRHTYSPKQPAKPKKTSPEAAQEPFSFLKEYREIYELPKSDLVVDTDSKVVEEKKPIKKHKKKKIRFVASPVSKHSAKKKAKRRKMKKPKKKSKKKKVEEDTSVHLDDDISAELLDNSSSIAPIRKRRVAEKKRFLFGDVDNPATLVETDQLGGDKDKFLDGNLIESELDDEMEGSEFDPKKLQSLQLLIHSTPDTEDKPVLEKLSRQTNKELKNIKEELNSKSLGFDHLMRFPKLPSVRCCRFELPMDTSLLFGLKPMDYLKRHCIVASKRRQLCEKIFGKFRSVENVIVPESLFRATCDAFGESVLNMKQFRSICKLADFNNSNCVQLEEFIGLVALAERYLCQSMEGSEPKDTIEEMDFNYLNVYKSGVEIEENLNKLLIWIKCS